jgi:[ribosomal protein S5]-alanine N-acetyltransferase
MFPVALRTARLILRPIVLSDAAPIFDTYAQDPEVTRFLTWRPHTAIVQTEAYIARVLAARDTRTYALTERDGGKLLGAFDIRQSGPGRLGYGYVLARFAWGHGLMTEALAAVADWALMQPDIWRIGDVCDVENRASARVMEKAGLSFEGIARRWIIHPNISNEPRDCRVYARVK